MSVKVFKERVRRGAALKLVLRASWWDRGRSGMVEWRWLTRHYVVRWGANRT